MSTGSQGCSIVGTGEARAKVVERFDALDGLRGIAALIVVIGHFWPFQDFKSLPIINVFMDTKLPVAVFFVLSGVVLSHSARNITKDSRWLVFAVVARYIRLLIPILVISVIVAFLYLNGLIFVDSLPSSYSQWSGFSKFYQFSVDVVGALKFSFFDVFFQYRADQTYIPPAWTMRPELFASTLLFVFLYAIALLRLDRIPVLLFIPAAVAVFFTKAWIPGVFYFGYFLVGYVLYELYKKHGVNPRFGIALFVWVLILKSALFYLSIKGLLVDFVFAGLIVASVLFSAETANLFSNRFFGWLGKISFPLYLIHVPIISSLGMFGFGYLDSLGIDTQIGAFLCFAVVLVVCIVSSHLLVTVDSGTLKLLRVIKGRFGLTYAGDEGGSLRPRVAPR